MIGATVSARPDVIAGTSAPVGDWPPRRALVTGCAGFLGSRLSERLVAMGTEVVGIDAFVPTYDRAIKERNLRTLLDEDAFELVEGDLVNMPLGPLLDGVDTVFHLAAQAGVRTSFGAGFAAYLHHNVQATQRLLEACAAGDELAAFVYASSSSVYGDSALVSTAEQDPLRPCSPYGMTKLATEAIAGVYHRHAGVPVTGLRYFTAYGPRQRPDMAFSRFLRSALAGEPLRVFGDGHQTRDFTFVDDVVTGTIAAARSGRRGTAYNIGGGTSVALRDAVGMIGELVGRSIDVRFERVAPGDVRNTRADTRRARTDLGFVPATPVRTGLEAQLAWTTSASEGARPAVTAGR